MATLQDYYNTNDDSENAFWSTVWVAQSFTAQATYDISSVKLKLYKAGNPGTITVSIRATDGDGKPTGADINGVTGTTNGNTLPITSGTAEWREITLSSAISLTSGTKYAIVVRALTGSSPFNYVKWRYDGSSPTYTGGAYHFSTNSGSTWSINTAIDFMFETYGDPVPPEKPINPTPEHEGSGIGLNDTTATWEDGGGATSYNIYFGTLSGFLSLVAEGVTDLEQVLLPTPFSHYGEIYYWRVDAVNEAGTTEGDEWSFTTLIFDPALPTGVTIVDGEPTGTPTGENNMITVKRLVAAANNKIWYEDI